MTIFVSSVAAYIVHLNHYPVLVGRYPYCCTRTRRGKKFFSQAAMTRMCGTSPLLRNGSYTRRRRNGSNCRSILTPYEHIFNNGRWRSSTITRLAHEPERALINPLF